MKLETMSKIFGLLASISFMLAITIFSYYPISRFSFIEITMIFLLAAILVTLKRIAHSLERKD